MQTTNGEHVLATDNVHPRPAVQRSKARIGRIHSAGVGHCVQRSMRAASHNASSRRTESFNDGKASVVELRTPYSAAA